MQRSPRFLLFAVALLAFSAPAASVKVEQEPVVLGRTESVRLELTLDEPAGTEERPLQLQANVGTFGDVRRLGPGRYTAVYIPPATRFPQVALIAAWRETGPEAPIEFFRVPLSGVTRVPVKAKAGSELKVLLGKEISEPVVANARGEATLSLVVPPGLTEAELTVKEPSGLVTQKRLPIDVPPYNRLTAALVPHAVRADGRAWVRLEVFYDLGGADVPPSRLKVTPSVGTVALLQASQGRYVYRYVPPEGAPDAAKISVSVKGDATSTAQVKLNLSAPSATHLVVRPPTTPLSADGISTATVQVLATDDAGLGVSGQRPQLSANGQPLEVSEVGAGLYQATLRAPARYPSDGRVLLAAKLDALTATASYPLKAAAVPAALTARLLPDPAPADGRTEVEVLLDVRDGAGAPLSGAVLEVTAAKGRVGPLVEQRAGRYRGTWTPPAGLSGDFALEVRDATGAFVRPVPVRLRPPPSFELGLRGGVLHTLGDQVSPRGAIDAWHDLLLGSLTFGVGLSVGYLRASQDVVDGAGAVVSTSVAHVLPLTARFGLELVSTGRFSLGASVGGVFAIGLFSTSLTQEQSTGFGGGGLGALTASLRLGPGRLFLEAGYGFAPVRTSAFSVQASGLFFDLGYRFSL